MRQGLPGFNIAKVTPFIEPTKKNEEKNFFQLQMFGKYGKNAYLCSTRTPKPLYNAQIGGRFFIYTMTVNFDKSYTSPESIIGILYERGLNIDDHSLAVTIHVYGTKKMP